MVRAGPDISDDDSEESDDEFGFSSGYTRIKHSERYVPPPEILDPKIEAERLLQRAATLGDLETLIKALDNSQGVTVQSPLSGGWSVLLHAAASSHTHIVQHLLDNGANPNQTCNSVTALMAACSCNASSEPNAAFVVQLLLSRGARADAADHCGQTALMRATQNGHSLIVEALLEHGAKVDWRDKQGWSASFYAVQSGHSSILTTLCERGARLDILDLRGRSLTHMAETKGDQECLQVLETFLPPVEGPQEDEHDWKDQRITSWRDMFPGILVDHEYTHEIPFILDGMHCTQLLTMLGCLPLRRLLTLTSTDLLRLGVVLPYQRRRVLLGLHRFHTQPWKTKETVLGLEANKVKDYDTCDLLSSLGSHLLHVHVMWSTLKYSKRLLSAAQEAGSKVTEELQTEARLMHNEISALRREIKQISGILRTVTVRNPTPADLIVEEHPRWIIVSKTRIFFASTFILAAVCIARSAVFNSITSKIKFSLPYQNYLRFPRSA